MKSTPDKVTMALKGTRMEMTRHTASLMIAEWCQVYNKFYLPDFPLEGRTVLDVGAGSGETIFFYLLHGAKKVIAIERDPDAVKMLRRNAEQNRWNVGIIHRPFELGVLASVDFDFMKMDIEGGESALLQFDEKLGPSVIEAHGEEIRDALIRKFDLVCVTRVWKDRYLLRTK